MRSLQSIFCGLLLVSCAFSCMQGGEAASPDEASVEAVLSHEETIAVDAFARAYVARPNRGSEHPVGITVHGMRPPASLSSAWRAEQLPLHSGWVADETLAIRTIQLEKNGTLSVLADTGGTCRDLWRGTISNVEGRWLAEVSYMGVGCIDP